MDDKLVLGPGVRFFRSGVVRQHMGSKDKRKKSWPHPDPQEAERMAGAYWDSTQVSKSYLWRLTPPNYLL